MIFRALLALLLVAGPVGAGPRPVQATAWQASYRLHDARGDHRLVVVCDQDRIEIRSPGQPVRAWRRLGDGLEHRAIFPADRRVVVFSPGDLRALGPVPEWADVRGLVPSRFLAGAARPMPTIAGHAVERHRGNAGGASYDVAWIPDAGLPSRYVRTGAHASRLTLERIEPVDGATAFTPDDAYREMDAADLGDEELDPFARRFIVLGF